VREAGGHHQNNHGESQFRPAQDSDEKLMIEIMKANPDEIVSLPHPFAEQKRAQHRR
jgi:hypothetical protein